MPCSTIRRDIRTSSRSGGTTSGTLHHSRRSFWRMWPWAAVDVKQQLDGNFFRVRMDRVTPAEKEYLVAMADLGAGPHRSGDIATSLGVKVESVAPRRSGLIKKGMLYSPAHGDTAFTVPMFDDFLRRSREVE